MPQRHFVAHVVHTGAVWPDGGEEQLAAAQGHGGECRDDREGGFPGASDPELAAVVVLATVTRRSCGRR
jgi:hypothetical protein